MIMLISKISGSFSKNNRQRNKNNRTINTTSLQSQQNQGNIAFKKNLDLEALSKCLKAMLEEEKKPIILKGNTPLEKVEDVGRICKEKSNAAGEKFKSYMNPVLEFFARKGLIIDVRPYKSQRYGDMFESKIIIDKNSKSHLVKTWQDAHQWDTDDTHKIALTPNFSRLTRLEQINNHCSYYSPSLFQEDLMASEYAGNMSQYRPKLPKVIADKIHSLISLDFGMMKIFKSDLSINSNDLHRKALERVMPEDGILDTKALSKMKQLADDYTPVYAMPFDWKSYNENLQRQFTI